MNPTWDELPLLGVGATGQVRRDGAWVVKLAHPDPEARARLREEGQLHRALERRGFPVPQLARVAVSGRFLVRAYVAQAPFGRTRRPSPDELKACFELWRWAARLEDELEVRLDVSPSNLVVWRGRALLLDAGRRVAPSVFHATTLRDFAAEWTRYLQHAPKPRLGPVVLPPSGRFHVDVGLAPTRGRVVWLNRRLLARLELPWTEGFLRELGAWTTQTRRPTTTRPATRYVDMLWLDRRAGPKGDGRSVALGEVQTAAGPREVSVKGAGPTPLAWKGRAFHSDGRVSFPRTLWEVSVADELGRLGFDVPEYLAVIGTDARTFDNTRRWWPAAAGLRITRTHWRLGHLRAVSHQPAKLRALLRHVGRDLVRADFRPDSPAHVAAFVRGFAEKLGHDVGRTDALQAHCFNPTPGNVRLDGHFIDFSTVRFFRHYMPDFRFLEHRYGVRLHRVAWRRLVTMLLDVLAEGNVRCTLSVETASRRFDAAYRRGFVEGLRAFYPLRALEPGEARRLVSAAQALRAERSDRVETFAFWKQAWPGPRFDLLGRAPELVSGLRRGHAQPWLLLAVDRDDSMPASARRVGERFVRVLAPLLTRDGAARRWSEVVRPGMELEALARTCYQASTPRSATAWRQLLASGRHLPEGRYDYLTARTLARRLGHVALPTVDGRGFEVVVGVTPELLDAIRRTLGEVLGADLVGVVAHGSRVMERRRVVLVQPTALVGNDLRVRGRGGVREYGPSPEASSDLDLKVFVRRARSEADARQLGERLAALGAWLPLSAHRPPRQRLLVTASDDVRAAFRNWNGGPRAAQLGKGPIPACQAVVLDDGRGGPNPLDYERWLDALPTPDPDHLTRVAVSKVAPRPVDPRLVHQWELALRDDARLQPEVTIEVRGRTCVATRGAAVVEAARRAGRSWLWVTQSKR